MASTLSRTASWPNARRNTRRRPTARERPARSPMAALGTLMLLAAFVVCSYAATISVVGARRGSRRLIESGIGAFYWIAALMTVASAIMVNAFLTGDYSIRFVQHYSDSVQPLFYKITSYWGGLDGSI